MTDILISAITLEKVIRKTEAYLSKQSIPKADEASN